MDTRTSQVELTRVASIETTLYSCTNSRLTLIGEQLCVTGRLEVARERERERERERKRKRVAPPAPFRIKSLIFYTP